MWSLQIQLSFKCKWKWNDSNSDLKACFVFIQATFLNLKKQNKTDAETCAQSAVNTCALEVESQLSVLQSMGFVSPSRPICCPVWAKPELRARGHIYCEGAQIKASAATTVSPRAADEMAPGCCPAEPDTLNVWLQTPVRLPKNAI